jgi:hypothetical protein
MLRLALSIFALLIFALLLLQVAVSTIPYLTPHPVKSQQRTLKGF